MNILLLIFVGFALLLNVFATYAVTQSASHTTERKTIQVILVWLIPLLGAIICIVFERADRSEIPTQRSSEFCENADSSGSD